MVLCTGVCFQSPVLCCTLVLWARHAWSCYHLAMCTTEEMVVYYCANYAMASYAYWCIHATHKRCVGVVWCME